MQMRDASRITRNSTSHGHDTIVQIMHINQRIRIKTPDTETLSNFFQKLILYYEIEQSLNQLGLLERKGKGKYEFIQEKGDIQPDHLYYLYFKEKPDKISPVHNVEEETKKSRSQYSNSPTTNSGSMSRRYNSSYSQFQGIEKVKRPKDEKKILICPFEKCLKEFSETGNLKTHMRTHTGERPFVCQQCGQQFITKGHLQAHELTHTGEKPFICNFHGCNKRYSRAGRLKIHQRLHTGERPFICQMEGCEKAFREKGNLLTHMRIHNGQKPFRCDFADCDMMFTTQGHLTDHKRRHSGERPYICDVCNDKFMRSSTLKIHMRRHTGEKPYKCDKCDRAFSESGNLRTHLKTHEDERFESFSPLGKRIKRDSKFSSPRSGYSSNKKRTLKAVSKNNMNRSNFSEEPYSPDSIKPMPQLQLDFKANISSITASNNIQLRKGSGQIMQNQQNHNQRQNLPSQSPIKEEDIKIPLVKQENNMPNENYGSYLMLNEPQSVTQQYIQQQPMQQGLLMNPFSPSSILNQNQLSQFSSPRFNQYHQQHQHLLSLNTPTDTNTMRINARKIQNQQPIQQFQDIKKIQQANNAYMQQVNSSKFSPLGGQMNYHLDSPDMNQHHGIIVSSQVQNAKLMTDMSPLYRKQDGQVLKLAPNQNVNQLISSQQSYQLITSSQQMQGQPQIQIISSVQGQQTNTNQEEEAQSFSSLAKFWQNRGGSQSPCVSQDASPLLRKPSMTPRNGNEWQQNYPNMSGSNLKLNNQVFNPSENSAFKRGLSPKVMIDHNGNTVIHSFNSPSNTPKLMAAEQMNRQMQIRKNSSFSNFQPPQQPMHIITTQQNHMLRPPNILTINQQQQMMRGSLSPSNFEDMQSPGIIPNHKHLGAQHQQQ